MPFQQANNTIAETFGGTGLGLSLVKNLCDAMGGAIKVDSHEHQGTCFTVSLTLPVADAAEQADSAPQPLAGIRIALCCDDPLWRLYLREQLETNGATVLAAGAHSMAANMPAIPCDTLLIACQDSQEEHTLPLIAHYAHARCVILTPLGPLPPEQRAEGIHVSALSQRSLLLSVNPACDVLQDPEYATLSLRDRQTGSAAGFPGDVRFDDSLCDDPAESPARIAAAKHAAALKILLVEDDLVNVTLARQQLAMLGYTDIDLACNGQEALEKCKQQTYQVILTDQFMPEMDGNRLTAALRQQAYPAVIIMLTASRPQPADRKNLDAVLLKPVSLEQLRTALSHHSPPASPSSSSSAAAAPSAKKMLWEAFLQDYADTMDTFDVAIQAGDKRQCLQQLHKLKGAMEILRQPLAKKVAALERRCKTTPIAEWIDTYRMLRQALDRVVADHR